MGHREGRALKISSAAALMLVVLESGSAAGAPAATPAQLVRVSDTLLEIRGGGGRQSWVIRYGSLYDLSQRAQWLPIAGDRAWFSHGGWLRLIDTRKGVVVGRWHVPGTIVRLTAVESRIQIETVTKTRLNDPVRRTITLDPTAGTSVPYWPTENLSHVRLPNQEASIWKLEKTIGLAATHKISRVGKGKELLPELEEASKRDPISPWIQLCYARLLRILGDRGAGPAFDRAAQMATTDFTELLPLSSFLDQIGEREAARTAFERGYRNFFELGNDPRMLMVLINKLILYFPWGAERADLKDSYNRELMERTYRLTPRCEGADLAWAAYAKYFEENGWAEEAALWRARSADARETSSFYLPRWIMLVGDRLILTILGSLIAAAVLFAWLWLRYLPQRRADSAAYQSRSWMVRAISWLNFQYWSRSQRVAFLTIVVIAWVSTGWATVIMAWILRAAAGPVSLGWGSLAGPTTLDYLETRQPKTPEQSLFLAVAYQQDGQNDKAERLYRSLPDFAESWNNLGVLEKETGKDQQARQSFERALQLDPNLHEAALNLGQSPPDLWTELHHKYLPDRPMIAPPGPARMGPMFTGFSFRMLTIAGAIGGPVFGLVAGHENLLSFFTLFGGETSGADLFSRVASYGLIAALIFAVILVFLRRRPAAPRAGMLSTVVESLFPGVSPAWSFAGGLALVAWVHFLVADLLLWRFSTSAPMTFMSIPNIERAYRVPGAAAFTAQMIRPGWEWVYLAPALLLAVNLLLVLRSRSRQAEA